MVPRIEEPEEQGCPEGHVRLQLYQVPDSDSTIYLEIPLEVINLLCLHPRKYLQYLAWAILAIDGHISESDDGEAISVEGDLTDSATYYYVHEELGPNRVVDLETIRTRSVHSSSVASETTRELFKADLVRRDIVCIFTGLGVGLSEAQHLVPHARGIAWLKLIIANRPAEGEDNVSDIADINDKRNGFLGNPLIHKAHGSSMYAILKTPNHVLTMNDVPRRERPDPQRLDTRHPSHLRMTGQWLVDVDTDPYLRSIPNNLDARTGRYTRNQSLPAGVILHYLYGAAALKLWGKNTQYFDRGLLTPRPPKLVPAPMGPEKKVGDRSKAIGKRDEARKHDEEAEFDGGAEGSGEDPQDSEEDIDKPDALDMVMFFWGNNPAAVQRHQEEKTRMASNIRDWAQGVHA